MLFEPSVKDMFGEYPELSDYDEFKDLTFRQLKFAWYLGNRTSPLINEKLGKAERYKKAVRLSYGNLSGIRDDIKKLAKGDLPEKIKAAIFKMAEFDVRARMKAQFMTEYIFDKLNSIVSVDDEFLNELDFDEKKKYSDLAIKISESLPEMIKRIESGFGIKKKKVENEDEINVGIYNL